jgi:hypothetical protein
MNRCDFDNDEEWVEHIKNMLERNPFISEKENSKCNSCKKHKEACEKPKEGKCSQCNRNNDIGVKNCWFCGIKNPC